MQTPKTSGSAKSSSGSVTGRRISPRRGSLETTKRSSGRVVRQLKTSGLEPSSSTSQPVPSIRTPKSSSSPKFIDRVSPRGPVTELQKNRVGRIAELETQVAQLEDALRTVKDQLIVSESWKKQAKLDAEESRMELSAITFKLQESQKLLAWSSSNQEVHEPNSNNSAALAAALLEIDQLKVKLDTTSESEVTQTKLAETAYTEIHILRENMAETLSLMEEMKNQLEDCKISESQAQALASQTLSQLETARKTMESFKSRSGDYDALVLELQQSRARVSSLEGIIENMKTADEALKSADHKRFHDEDSQLKKSTAEIEELKANLMDKETELQCVLEENDDLNTKLANLISGTQENKLETESNLEVNDLKSKLASLEAELRKKSSENEKLKLEISKINSVIEDSKQDLNSLKSKSMILERKLFEKSDENEKLKLEIKKKEGVTEEVKKSKYETEEELRRLKVQMGQWRKAAEAATAMLCDENNGGNGMVVERTWSMGHHSPRRRRNMGSPCSMDIDDDNVDDDDDDLSKRKNGSNMLKRIGVLWKKPQSK